MRRARPVLLLIGLGLLGVGALHLTRALHTPAQWLNLGLWLAAAVLAHDAVLAPAFHVGDLVLRRTTHRVGGAARTVLRSSLLAALLLTAVGLAERHAKELGPRNPSVLPLDYGRTLVGVWVLTLLVCAATLLIERGRARRRG